MSQTRYWVGSSPGDWNNSLNWSDVSGGVGGFSVPGVGASVIFDAASGGGVCTLTANVVVSDISLNGFTGAIDLQGFVLSLTGTALLRTGEVRSSAPGSPVFTAVNATQIEFDGTDFRVPVEGVVAELYFSDSEFFEPVDMEKSGGGDNYGDGGVVFHRALSLQNSGGGQLFLSYNFPDQFRGVSSFFNSGTGSIRVASGSFGNQFLDDVSVSSTGGIGVFIGDFGFGGASLADGAQLQVGAGGFSSGQLGLFNFNQIGLTPQTLALTATSELSLGNGTLFNGAVQFSAPGIFLGGTTFNNSASLEKTGTGVEFGFGGAVFNGVTSITNSGTGLLFLANVNPDRYNNSVTYTVTGGGAIYPSYAATNSLYYNAVVLNSVSSNGIYFGFGGGSTQLQDGAQLQVGPMGFQNGRLELVRITQLGSTGQNISLAGSSFLYVSNSVFNAAIDFRAAQIEMDRNTFNGTTYIEKNGALDNNSGGGNQFNGITTIVNSGTGYFTLAAFLLADTYSGSVTFVQTSTGLLRPSYNTNDTYRGSISTFSTSSIVFGAAAGGRITFSGTNNQSVSVVGGSAAPRFQRATINKTAGSVDLQTPVVIVTNFTFTRGVIVSSSVNRLDFLDNATATGASNNSYVSGPVRKYGNDAFVFPVGSEGYHRSIRISAPGNVADHFTAQYFRDGQVLGNAMEPSLVRVSGCEYWSLERSGGTSNVIVRLSWLEAACLPGDVTIVADLRVAQWDGTTWINRGNGGTTGTTTSGTINSAGAVSSFTTSFFTLSSVSFANPLPIELAGFQAAVVEGGIKLLWTTLSEQNNDFFTLERSGDGLVFEEIGKVEGGGTQSAKAEYSFLDAYPLQGKNYYRLVQTDFDGTSTRSEIVRAVYGGSGEKLKVYPNPVNDIIHLNRKAWVRIRNTANQVLFEGEAEHIDVSGLQPGLYLLSYQGQSVPFIKK